MLRRKETAVRSGLRCLDVNLLASANDHDLLNFLFLRGDASLRDAAIA